MMVSRMEMKASERSTAVAVLIALKKLHFTFSRLT